MIVVDECHTGNVSMPMLSKFDELRLKTDTELIQLVDGELNVALSSLFRAVESLDHMGSPSEPYVQAERAYARACRLITVIYCTDEEQARLASRAEHLRKMLDWIASPQTPSEDDIAAIARSLWHARGCPEGVAEEDWYWAERALKTRAQAACV